MMQTISVDTQGVTFKVTRPAISCVYPAYRLQILDDIGIDPGVVATITASFTINTVFTDSGFYHVPVLWIQVFDKDGKILGKTELPLSDFNDKTKEFRRTMDTDPYMG